MAKRGRILEPEIDHTIEVSVGAIVDGCQVKLSKGKHIEVKLLIPYEEGTLTALGGIAGLHGVAGRTEVDFRGMVYKTLEDDDKTQLPLAEDEKEA
jgi:hypothetical protein